MSDNGVGKPEEASFENLGMKLINMFIQQLKGTITMEEEDGITYKITCLKQG